MSPKRLGATVAAVIVTPWLLVVITLYVFRIVVCADREVRRKASPDGRTVAVERDEACLINHATAVYLERGGLPRTTLVWGMVERVQGVELTWHGNHELWVTVEASAKDAAAEAGDAPRRFDDVTIRYFGQDGGELRAGR